MTILLDIVVTSSCVLYLILKNNTTTDGVYVTMYILYNFMQTDVDRC